MRLASILLVAACSSKGPSSTNTAREMFEHVILKPVPAEITELQGAGDTWQGYALWMRFKAPAATVEAIVKTGYEPVDCAEIRAAFELPKGYDRFTPAWAPPLDGRCFGGEIKNDWGNGSHHLLVDAAGTVHFHGTAP